MSDRATQIYLCRFIYVYMWTICVWFVHVHVRARVCVDARWESDPSGVSLPREEPPSGGSEADATGKRDDTQGGGTIAPVPKQPVPRGSQQAQVRSPAPSPTERTGS